MDSASLRPHLQSLLREQVGPAAAIWIESAELSPAAEWLSGGWKKFDVALGLMHLAIRAGGEGSEALRREFHGFIYKECSGQRGVTGPYPRIRSTYETHDLLSEVVLDVMAPDSKVEFLGLSQFCSLVLMRMAWRASEISRRMENRSIAHVDMDVRDGGGNTPQDLSEQKEDIRIIQAALGKLHPRDRVLIELHLSGLTSAEVGEKVALRPPAVRKALQRAMEALRSSLQRSE